MEEIGKYLEALHLDLRHVSQLFSVEDRELEDQALFDWKVWEQADCFRCHMRWHTTEHELSVAVPEATGDARLDELHRKRAVRRLCRQTLYQLLKKATGIHPPWGAMTGIRPTRLFYEALEQGVPEAEVPDKLMESFDLLREKADLLAETVSSQQKMQPPDDAQADLYIGIPFCTTRCAYCSFSSGEIGDGHLVEPYLNALIREMRSGRRTLDAAGKRPRALYIGGGTPTSLTAAQLERLLNEARTLFPEANEWTVEAGRPDTLDREKLKLIHNLGMTRISINPQTMHDETLRRIGRAQTAAQVVDAYRMAREIGISDINMDIIAGLPGEDTAAFDKTLAWARELQPQSLTVHTLAIKRTSRLQTEGVSPSNVDEVASMVQAGKRTAECMGMKPYYLYRQKHMTGNLENVGYALPGYACQYNVDMMEETTHILAFGAGAISKRVYPEEGHIERAPNVSNIEVYLQRAEEMAERKHRLFCE